MPTYDYRCDHCGHTFTMRQGFDDPPLERCPRCGERPRRLVSRPSIVFKGSGWHVTDYRAKPPESSGDGASGASDAKTDPKKSADAKKKDATGDASKGASAPSTDPSSGSTSKKPETS